MSIRVVYDPQVFMWQKVGGISRYFAELAVRIAAMPDFDAHVYAIGHVNEYLKVTPYKNIVCGMVRPNINYVTRLSYQLTHAAWTGVRTRFAPQILHETYYSRQGLSAGKARRVTTVYDCIHERYPEMFPDTTEVLENKAASIARADHVFCISENTKLDVIKHYSVTPDKVSVVYLGSSLRVTGELPACPVAEPFVLFVGSRTLYKNFEGVVKAFADPQLHRHFVLVCLGSETLNPQEQEWIKASGIPAERVRQMTGDDALLVTLYRHAACMVYPSFYEGFGIPPLEAMEQNCPVICSNTSSLPEVVGDAAETLDPSDPDALRQAFHRVLFSEERQRELKRLGSERVKLFSWDQCAAQTAGVYRRLAG